MELQVNCHLKNERKKKVKKIGFLCFWSCDNQKSNSETAILTKIHKSITKKQQKTALESTQKYSFIHFSCHKNAPAAPHLIEFHLLAEKSDV